MGTENTPSVEESQAGGTGDALEVFAAGFAVRRAIIAGLQIRA